MAKRTKSKKKAKMGKPRAKRARTKKVPAKKARSTRGSVATMVNPPAPMPPLDTSNPLGSAVKPGDVGTRVK